MKSTCTKVGFVLSIVSLVINPYCACGVAALILCIIGMSQEKKQSGAASKLAVAGIIIGAVSVVLEIFYLIFLMPVLTQWAQSIVAEV